MHVPSCHAWSLPGGLCWLEILLPFQSEGNQCLMDNILYPEIKNKNEDSEVPDLPSTDSSSPSSLRLPGWTYTGVHAALMTVHCQQLLMHVSLLSQGSG